MKKLSTWLKKNGYEITQEYSGIINSMSFKKVSTGQEYSIFPKYYGNKVAWHELYRENKYQDGGFIGNADTQQQIIDMLSKED